MNILLELFQFSTQLSTTYYCCFNRIVFDSFFGFYLVLLLPRLTSNSWLKDPPASDHRHIHQSIRAGFQILDSNYPKSIERQWGGGGGMAGDQAVSLAGCFRKQSR